MQNHVLVGYNRNMQKYDFIKEEIQDLIKKLKKSDYKASKYLEGHLVYDANLGGFTYTGSDEFFKEISKKVTIREDYIKKG